MMKKTLSLFLAFFKIGAFTFGGGYAMIALLENEFVEKKKWITKNEFLDMVAIAESTPGPVAVNSATYIGYKTAGFKGAAGGADIFLDSGRSKIYMYTKEQKEHALKEYERLGSV